MKTLGLFLICMVTAAQAQARGLCWKFDVSDPNAQLKELRVRSSDDMRGPWKVRAVTGDGQVFAGQLVCLPRGHQGSEWNCSRDDGGGKFTLAKTGEAAQFQTAHFDFGDEGAEENLALNADPKDPWSFAGEVQNCALPGADPAQKDPFVGF